MDLFDQRGQQILRHTAPLADRMRPRTLEEFIGQDHIVGPGRLLRRAIQIDQLSSLIFYGPPGTGKTTLARIIANTTRAHFLSINAVLAGIKEIREAVETAQQMLSLYGRRTILFIDEVHRFNKAQQDALLPHVENGTIILIGATTENPYFEVNKALVSRSRIFQLRSLDEEALRRVALTAIGDCERGYGNRALRIDDDALAHLVKSANGDARALLNALELAVETTPAASDGIIHITMTIAEESIQQKAVLYDRDGDVHYDTISAFIKSVRGSDPDAALYWLARMIYAGEDPRFILRRMAILACEDVGLADPFALGVVIDAVRAFDFVGMPEGRYHLAFACLYLACAPKSNSTMAFFDALDVVSKDTDGSVPNHLRDASRDGNGFDHGKGYLYPHAYRDHWVAQQYLPEVLQGRIFYHPTDQGYEMGIQQRVARLREAKLEAMVAGEGADPLIAAEAPAVRSSRSEQWAQRSLSDTVLAEIRDHIMELALIGPQSVVLDVEGRTGLLCCEAARRVREGGVWVVAHNEQATQILNVTLKQFDVLARPQIIVCSWEDLESKVRTAAGRDVAFTAIIGRSVLSSAADRVARVRCLDQLMHPRARMVFAEPVGTLAQRPSQLPGIPQGVRTLLSKAEEELFADKTDPLVNWTPTSLAAELQQTSGLSVEVTTLEHRFNRRISSQEIAFWFRTGGSSAGGRMSLGDRLRSICDEEQVAGVQAALEGCLANRVVPWKSVTAFFVLKRQHKVETKALDAR